MRAAASAGRPWVLDPVAAAASDFRMEACLSLLALRPAVVRGNASEILALASRSAAASSTFKGVDSTHDSGDALQAAKALARSTGAVVAVSGAVDYITDGAQVVGASNGVALMQKITATGCAVTALVAAFVAVEPSDALVAAACALAVFGLAGVRWSRRGAPSPCSAWRGRSGWSRPRGLRLSGCISLTLSTASMSKP
uniref:hydroxyethylthiazole kinase n=1 Tax=Oryza brachyantha TaxID=4533 RepID=J3KZV3_ORYBR